MRWKDLHALTEAPALSQVRCARLRTRAGDTHTPPPWYHTLTYTKRHKRKSSLKISSCDSHQSHTVIMTVL